MDGPSCLVPEMSPRRLLGVNQALVGGCAFKIRPSDVPVPFAKGA